MEAPLGPKEPVGPTAEVVSFLGLGRLGLLPKPGQSPYRALAMEGGLGLGTAK